MKFNAKEVHERRHFVTIDRHQLIALITEAVCKEIGVKSNRAGVSVTVKLEAVEEGSPAYKVGTRAVIEVIEDMLPQVADMPNPV